MGRCVLLVLRKVDESMSSVHVSEVTEDAKVPDMCVRLCGAWRWLGSIGQELEDNDKRRMKLTR
jgi:hypothetical protein